MSIVKTSPNQALITVFFLIQLFLFPLATIANENISKPKLIVLLIVDQLPMSRVVELGSDPEGAGFRQIYTNGVVFNNALYNHANTSTAPGHASIATGALPASHGIVANFWLNQQTKRPMLSTAEPGSFLLGIDEVKPGATPGQLDAPTFSDRLMEKLPDKSKVFAVSMKDRGSVFTAGKYGKAFWYEKDFGKFITSNYYYNDRTLPYWLSEYNQQMFADIPDSWQLLLNKHQYKLGKEDNRQFERPVRGWNNEFPHKFSRAGGAEYFRQVYSSPYADLMTIRLAKKIIQEENLGDDEHTDLLSISLSASDEIGHRFGPYSLEAEDNGYRLDRLLGDFISYLNSRYAKDNFLLVLTSDHGILGAPETIKGIDTNASRISARQLARGLNEHIKDSLNIGDNLVRRIIGPLVYFNTVAIKEQKLDTKKIIGLSITWLENQSTIARAIQTSTLNQCQATDEICLLVSNNVYPGRTGEIYLVQSKYSFFDRDPPAYATNHGSPYRQDRHVPVIFYGLELQAKQVERQIQPNAIAPTLVNLLDLKSLETNLDPLLEISR